MREPPFAKGFGVPGQEQFLQVLDRDEAERRFRAAVDLSPRGVERVALDAALGRVLAADVVSPVDVPSFDRSNVDGFALIADNTFGASADRDVQNNITSPNYGQFYNPIERSIGFVFGSAR